MSDFELADQRNFFIERAVTIQDYGFTTIVAIAAIAASISREAYTENPLVFIIGFGWVCVTASLINVRRARFFIDHAKLIDDIIVNEHLQAEKLVTVTRNSLFFGSNAGLAILWLIVLIIILYRTLA